MRRLRTICLGLPDTRETITFGHPTFRTRGGTFAVLEVYRGELTIALKAGFPIQEVLLQDERPIRTPYVGKHGWVSLRVVGPLDAKPSSRVPTSLFMRHTP